MVLWDAATGRPVNFPFGRRMLPVSAWSAAGKEGMNLRGLAVAGNRLYTSLHHEDKVLEFDWKTGKRIRKIAMPKPCGLATRAAGEVYAVSDRKIVRIDPAAEKSPTVVAGGSRSPTASQPETGGCTSPTAARRCR